MYVLKDILKKYDLKAKKSLGQNFILDSNLLCKIARTALINLHPSVILEVGPGPGGLTQALLEQTNIQLVAIEKDDRCIKALQELKQDYPNLTVIHDDAVAFNEKILGENICVVANLPYNVSTILLIKWLKEICLFSRLTLMFQKEVADRLVALPGDSSYGRLSVLVGWLCDVSIEMTLPPYVFTPMPKVTSALVRITPKMNPYPRVQFEMMEKVTAAAFGQRRKMLRSSLKKLGDPNLLCAEAGIETTLRAQDVPIEAYCKMALCLQEGER